MSARKVRLFADDSLMIEGNFSLFWRNVTDTRQFWPFEINMQHLMFVVMCLGLVVLVLTTIIVVRARRSFVRWRRRRRAGPRISVIDAQGVSVSTPQCGNNGARRGLLSRMLARIEEFDSLTPLIITPNSLSDDGDGLPTNGNFRSIPPHLAAGAANAGNGGGGVPVNFRGSPRRRPRSGKITLFPLASNARRAEFYSALEPGDVQDSNSICYVVNPSASASSTAKPAGGLLMNNNNGGVVAPVLMRNPFEDLDLVSIDRTSGASTIDRRSGSNHDLLGGWNGTQTAAGGGGGTDTAKKYSGFGGGTLGVDPLPLSALPSPASTDLLVAASELQSSAPNINNLSTGRLHRSCNSLSFGNGQSRNGGGSLKRETCSVDSLSSNLSSPMDSSVCGDTGSPLDTTGSLAELSDSVYMASESETSDANRQSGFRSEAQASSARWYTVSTSDGASDRSDTDLSTFEFETPANKRYVLHRIEEESEDVLATPSGCNTGGGGRSTDQSRRSKDRPFPGVAPIASAAELKFDDGNNKQRKKLSK